MTLPTVSSEQYPTPDEVLAQCLADMRWSYAQDGVVVNVERGSDHYRRAAAFAETVSIAIANGQLARTAMSPLTAQGDDLVEMAGWLGVTKRPAAASTGFVIVETQNLGGGSYATVTIPVDYEWTAPDGTKCTAVGGDVTNGELMAVVASTTGESTEVPAGSVGLWTLASIGYLLQTAKVASGGITGGHAEDDQETLRARLLRKLSRPAVGGNSAHLQELAEASSSAIAPGGAFVYMAVRGPSSWDMALTSATGDRTVSAAVISTARAACVAEEPGFESENVTTVVPEELDMVVGLKLPLPVTVGGSGGGWLDGVPWPSDAETTPNVFGEITSIADIGTSKVTVNSTSTDPPVAGDLVALWDPTLDADNMPNGFQRFGVAEVTGSSGAYVIRLDVLPGSSLSFIEVGMRFSPDCARLKQYGDAVVAAFLALGPGEKTTSPEILPRGRRVPAVDDTPPSSIELLPIARLSQVGPEVIGASIVGSFATGTFTTQIEPSIPATTLLAPRILTLKHLSFRKVT